MPKLSVVYILLLALLLPNSCDQYMQKVKGSGGAANNQASGGGNAGASNAGQSASSPAGDPVRNCPLAGFTLPPGADYTLISDRPDNWTIQLSPDVDYSALLQHIDATLGQRGWRSNGVEDFGNGKLAIYTKGSDTHSVGVQYSAEPDTVPFCIVNVSKTPE